MELIEFLKNNSDVLSIRGIEKRLGVKTDTIRNALNNKCILSDNDGCAIIDLLGFGNLTYSARKKKSIKKDRWDLASNYKSAPAGSYRIVNGHAQKPELRNGIMMVKI